MKRGNETLSRDAAGRPPAAPGRPLKLWWRAGPPRAGASALHFTCATLTSTFDRDVTVALRLHDSRNTYTFDRGGADGMRCRPAAAAGLVAGRRVAGGPGCAGAG